MTPDSPQSSSAGIDATTLAVDRTLYACERTLMAWIRTAASLITFGFTLYKFFFYLHEQDPVKHAESVFGARAFGLVMMGIGVISLALATWQHQTEIKRLRPHAVTAQFSLALLVATLIAGLGLLGLFSSLFHY